MLPQAAVLNVGSGQGYSVLEVAAMLAPTAAVIRMPSRRARPARKQAAIRVTQRLQRLSEASGSAFG